MHRKLASRPQSVTVFNEETSPETMLLQGATLAEVARWISASEELSTILESMSRALPSSGVFPVIGNENPTNRVRAHVSLAMAVRS